jgi:predicted GTPase
MIPPFILTSPHQPRQLVDLAILTIAVPSLISTRTRTRITSTTHALSRSLNSEFAVAVVYKPYPIQDDTTESSLLILYYPLLEERVRGSFYDFFKSNGITNGKRYL